MVRKVVTAACLLIASTACTAGSLDQNTSDFRFRFDIKGYQRGGWFEDPSALAVDKRSSLLYVADQKADAVYGFSLQAVPKFEYGPSIGLKAPIGLAVDSRGDIFVSEADGSPIKIIDSHGQVATLQIPAQTGLLPPKPGRMSFDQDGNLYVLDRSNGQICVFDKNRQFRLRFGAMGSKRGEFRMPQDVAVDRLGRIHVLDSTGVPAQVFDPKGNYIYRFGMIGEGERDMSFPVALFIDRNDQIWIVDRSQHSLKVFDRSGGFLRVFGSYGQAEGSLFHPIDADTDDLGRVYVLEAGARRVQVFSLDQPFEAFRP